MRGWDKPTHARPATLEIYVATYVTRIKRGVRLKAPPLFIRRSEQRFLAVAGLDTNRFF